MNRIAKFAVSLLLLPLGAVPAFALDDGWPRTVALDEGSVTIYAPTVEALEDGVLRYRAALAWRAHADAEPVFGAGWLQSPVDIDEAERVVRPRHLELTRARFPDGATDIQAALATALVRQSTRWDLDFPLADLQTALEAAEAESLAARELNTAPPKIIYRDRPALLVTIDGEPVLRDIENSPYQAVINTPFPLISDGEHYWLNAAKGAWYRAGKATGPYRFEADPPADIVRMVEETATTAADESTDETGAEAVDVTAASAPEIVVSTEPAELIVTDGPADFVPLVEDLLVLQNSDDDVFMHVGEQKYYIVLAGRWYRADSLGGPWEYRAADDLPADFARIPDDSAQADSRVFVAGTPEAEAAVLDAQVPQAAAVERGEVDIDVTYDGTPDFEPVDGTEELRYARNTGATVLQSDRTYYLLEDGVWYVSSSPDGPWLVSDHRPAGVETIQPSSPVYNTKYVYIYDATPEVVYVGYTPGYVGSYVHHHTIVYGTGWYYHPWVSPHYYYPRHRTWGFHVGYDSWSGWNFGLSWYWGPWNLSFYTGGYWHHGHSWHHRHWGYWGPRGYWYRPHHHGYRYHHYGYRPYGREYGRYDRYGYHDRDRWDRDRWDRDGWDGDRRDRNYDRDRRDGRWGRDHGRDGRGRHRNLYRDDRQRARVADTYDRFSGPGDGLRRGDDDRGARRDARQRFVDNGKIRQDTTGLVRPADLRMKARARDTVEPAGRKRAEHGRAGDRVVRTKPSAPGVGENRTTPITRADLHARADYAEKRSDRAAPISRSELKQRAGAVAARTERKPPAKSVARAESPTRTTRDPQARPVQKRESPARAIQQRERPARSVQKYETSPGTSYERELPARSVQKSARSPGTHYNREPPARTVQNRRTPVAPDRGQAAGKTVTRSKPAAPPRPADQRPAQSWPSRQAASPQRRIEQRAPQIPAGRQAPRPARQVDQRSMRQAPVQRVEQPAPRRAAAPLERRQSQAPAPRMERAAPQPRSESRGNRKEDGPTRRAQRRND